MELGCRRQSRRCRRGSRTSRTGLTRRGTVSDLLPPAAHMRLLGGSARGAGGASGAAGRGAPPGRGALRCMRWESRERGEAQLFAAGNDLHPSSLPTLRRPSERGCHHIEGAKQAPVTLTIVGPIPESDEGVVNRCTRGRWDSGSSDNMGTVGCQKVAVVVSPGVVVEDNAGVPLAPAIVDEEFSDQAVYDSVGAAYQPSGPQPSPWLHTGRQGAEVERTPGRPANRRRARGWHRAAGWGMPGAPRWRRRRRC